MTPTEQLAAIRKIIDTRPVTTKWMVECYQEIEALFDNPPVTNEEVAAVLPAPIPDTLPPGPVTCSCGDDNWQEVQSIIGTSGIHWTGDHYEYDGDSESYWDCSDFIRWECTFCGNDATPEQSAAISNRLG